MDVLLNTLPQMSIKWLTDGITTAIPGTPIIPQLMPVLTLIAICCLTMLFADIAASWLDGHYRPVIKAKIGEIVYDRLSKQSVAFFKDNSAGFLVEQANYVIKKFERICIDHVSDILILVISVAVNASLLFSIH